MVLLVPWFLNSGNNMPYTYFTTMFLVGLGNQMWEDCGSPSEGSNAIFPAAAYTYAYIYVMHQAKRKP